ncbi:HAD hydrolase family protein, partial [Acholeplasma sp. OttesenSCG-928-E16]|nr:HAD hydrolase family protein [Acholeplasma sp. OttesenSCG-928-E16]
FIVNPTDKSFKPIVKSMPIALFHELFFEFKDKVASALFNRGEQVYTYKYIKEFEWLINNTTSENIIEESFDKLSIAPSGLMLLVHNSDFEDLDSLIKTKYKDFLFTRNWGRDRKYTIYEVCAIDAHKSAAASYVIDYLGYNKEETICFGDGINDLELIRDAYFGVAMKNAYLEVKEVCDDITEFNNDNDGVIEYLKKYVNN